MYVYHQNLTNEEKNINSNKFIPFYLLIFDPSAQTIILKTLLRPSYSKPHMSSHLS